MSFHPTAENNDYLKQLFCERKFSALLGPEAREHMHVPDALAKEVQDYALKTFFQSPEAIRLPNCWEDVRQSRHYSRSVALYILEDITEKHPSFALTETYQTCKQDHWMSPYKALCAVLQMPPEIAPRILDFYLDLLIQPRCNWQYAMGNVLKAALTSQQASLVTEQRIQQLYQKDWNTCDLFLRAVIQQRDLSQEVKVAVLQRAADALAAIEAKDPSKAGYISYTICAALQSKDSRIIEMFVTHPRINQLQSSYQKLADVLCAAYDYDHPEFATPYLQMIPKHVHYERDSQGKVDRYSHSNQHLLEKIEQAQQRYEERHKM